MKTQLAIAAAGVLLVSTTGTAALAHDDGKGNVHPPTLEMQQQEFDNVVASNASDHSNAPSTYAPCVKGMAAKTYPCKGIDQMSHLSLDDLGLSFANDIWGWTDPMTGNDYALVGGVEGTSFVDISDPKRPDVVGLLPTHPNGVPAEDDHVFWRDIKVFDNHAFVVSENIDHGMQVFDLTQLRGVTGDPVTFEETTHYDGVANTHNLNINPDTGYAYLVGSDTCEGGLHMVDVNDPANPTNAGCFDGHGYIHDTQCVTYEGPDADHTGREICFNSAATFNEFTPEGIVNTVSVVDVTDKSDPVALDQLEYPEDGYSHQGWLTPDQGYFLHNDELDEVFHEGSKTTTRIFDVRDLDDISLTAVTDNGQTSIGHNAYTRGDRVYASNYTTGLRIADTGAVADGELPEIGYFDLYPENDNNTFEGGTWSNYPYYKSGVVATSSIERGLFVLKPRGNLAERN